MLSVVALAISFAGTSPAMHSSRQFVRRAVAAPLLSEADRGLRSTELIKFSSISDDYKELVKTALERLDRNRVLQGKPKYETIEGMIDSYVEASADAGYNWTREEAESEVTRYMMRQALADEGGIGNDGKGDGQDNAAFALLALLVGIVGYKLAGGTAPELTEGLKNPFL